MSKKKIVEYLGINRKTNEIKLYRACDCPFHPCRHNPPGGMLAARRRNHPGWWFIKSKPNWFERFYLTKIKDYIL